MMNFSYNREKKELLRVMKVKGEKKNIKVSEYKNKIQVGLKTGQFKNGEDSIPVTFKGTISEQENGCMFKGRFVYGFYLYTLVILAAILIAVRFAWSAYQHQSDNMILCAVVTALLIIVMAVVAIKSKPAKKIISDFLSNLNIK